MNWVLKGKWKLEERMGVSRAICKGRLESDYSQGR